MNADYLRNSILTHYPHLRQGSEIHPIGHASGDTAAGFSAARVFRVSAAAGEFCLRRWPDSQDRTQVKLIHKVLNHVSNVGLQFVPTPIDTSEGTSIVEVDGYIWELTTWLPGAADYPDASSFEKLANALRTLAKFHLASATFLRRPAAVSPTVLERLAMIRDVGRELGTQIKGASIPDAWLELASFREVVQDAFAQYAEQVRWLLMAAAEVRVPLLPCIRDVWHEHILFTGDEVTGIVDYGAMRIDSVATDLSRLLGSLAASSEVDWDFGLNAYQEVRPLHPAELQLVRALDQSSILLSGINWLKWILVEQRQFDDRQRVMERLTAISARLPSLGAV